MFTMTETKKTRKRKLQDFHIDLVIMWRSTEGLSYSECLERLVKLFGEEVRTSKQNLIIRAGTRLKKLERGEVPLRIKELDSLSNEDLLTWLKTLIYYQVHSAQAKNNPKELRANAEVMIKILRAIKDLSGDEQEDQLSAMDILLKELRGDQAVN